MLDFATPSATIELGRAAWAVFEPGWYGSQWPEAATAFGSGPADAYPLLRHYQEEGARLGYSPNRYFDENWYRAEHAGVAAAIASGEYASGFDHYCKVGHATLSGHWLFDEPFYRSSHPDLTDAALAAAGFLNGYDHYLRHGAFEGRLGHVMFDPEFYRAGLAQEAAAECERVGPFAHCLAHLAGNGDEVAISPYFNPAFYRARYPEIAAAIRAGRWRSALQHYLTNREPTAFDPLPVFSEQFYLLRYPDIAAEVAAGRLRSGYRHFLTDGARELRAPDPAIDLAWYLDAHERVRDDLRAGRARDAFSHYLRLGKPAGLVPAPPTEEVASEPVGRSLFRARARTLLPLWGRAPLDFGAGDAPVLSVVMVLHNRFELTMMALASLRQNYGAAIELILVDSGSTDETRSIERYVRGAKLIRFESNIGFVRGCNAGFYSVTAGRVLLLNNDLELGPGAVAAALRRLDSGPDIGAVGGKVIRSHGVLQEAGSIIWADGATSGYLRDGTPLAPEANFVRDVDYCSGVFLLVPADLLTELGGFDDAFAPAYYEDADLCVRMAQAGRRCVYDPAVVVHHLEHGSAVTRAASEAQIARGREVFATRHTAWLRSRPARRSPLFARFARPRRRVLFIEDRLPLRMLGSGFVRSNDIVATMAEMGLGVTVFPVQPSGADIAAAYADFPDSVEVMHDRDIDGLAAFLEERGGYFDAMWIARTHNLSRVLPALPAGCEPPRLILDTEAIAAFRDAACAAVTSVADRLDVAGAMRREFDGADRCDTMVAVSAAEADALREAGFARVHVLGHRRTLAPCGASWAERSGLLFVGAIHRPDSPNYDGLCWFVEKVLPLVEEELGWEAGLTVAGHVGEEVCLDRFAGHGRVTLCGPVPDTAPLYATHRVFVAPTRFAAGLPYKVHEAASFGLPVVATALLARQLGWTAEEDLLTAEVADPRDFAAAVVRLYRSESLWRRVREGALARIAREAAPDAYRSALQAILG